MIVLITINSDSAEMTINAEINGDCYITESKPSFPDNISSVVISEGQTDTILHHAVPIECASVDGRYWFSFRELTPEEIRQGELDNTLQMLTDCLLEMSETVYA